MGYLNDILSVTQLTLPWDKLQGCNVLITGATGLVGSALVEVLLSKNDIDYHVYASGRNEERAKKLFSTFLSSHRYHFVKYDVMQPLECNVRFDYIIDCASGAAPIEYVNRPVEVMKSNLFGVAHLLDYGRKHGMRRFVYVSSGEIYGEGDGREFIEDYSGYVNPMLSRSCYPSSKRAAETLCVSYASEYGMDVVIARPCHIYGPHFTESDNRVYAEFIRNVLRGEDIIMKSTGEQIRSWCYVVDCVSALLYILLKGECGEAYNIADPFSCITIKQLSDIIANIGGKKVIMDAPSDKEKSGYNPVTRSLYSTKKLQSLGWFIDSRMYENMKSTIEEVKII